MHQFVRTGPLGGQQLRRLRELRGARDGDVRLQHLGRSAATPPSPREAVDPLASRTVDAIIHERRQEREGVSTSTRLRDKVAAARRGVHTERIERNGGELRPAEKTRTTRKIAAVRRRGEDQPKSDGRRRLGRHEAEWIEKQTQYAVRAATLEKECGAAWQSFFAGAGGSASTAVVTAAEVNKLHEEMEASRAQDTQKVTHQLRVLSSKADDVQVKVQEIENGEDFLSELQERIDAMEAGLAKFKLTQRQQIEGFVLEEKMLEKELAVFLEKLNDWENEAPLRLGRGGTSNPNDSPQGNRDSTSRKQSKRSNIKSREKTERLLEQWKLDRKQKEEEEEQKRRELQKKRDAMEAKRKQEQLDAKQKVLLYKLQKEQEAMLLERTSKLRIQEGTDEDGLTLGPLPFSTSMSKEHLVERSRIAIEYAKAKRLRLQQIEERKQKQIQLPPRPPTKGVDESENSSPKQVMMFNATEASKARDLTKDELRKKARRRERQGAHDACGIAREVDNVGLLQEQLSPAQLQSPPKLREQPLSKQLAIWEPSHRAFEANGENDPRTDASEPSGVGIALF
ncbi:Coiled-coil domain-containing protein [Phytophthora cinnamomi]|uniref:Coiled-coil domain-containing protein n=1 Tax=Phytophthora cinnamomi TaxID=4785 RepID=UPI0035593CE9|nr:Coiled-coil domain-containing protein [Phytophthora cinnamomi]